MLAQFNTLRERLEKELGNGSSRKRAREPLSEAVQHHEFKLVNITRKKNLFQEDIIIPTNAHLKQEEKRLSDFLFNRFGLRIRPYSGQREAADDTCEGDDEENTSLSFTDILEDLSEEEAEGFDEIDVYSAGDESYIVNNLDVFDFYCGMPNLEKGHSKIDHTLIHFGYIAELEPFKPIGAIYFKIDLYLNQAEIVSLAINYEYRNKGLGSKLFDYALYIIALYGCDRIFLESSPGAKTLYLKHGFYYFKDDQNIPWQNYYNDLANGVEINGEQESLELWLNNQEGLKMLKNAFDKNVGYPVDIIQLLQGTQRFKEYYEAEFKAIKKVRKLLGDPPNMIMIERLQKRKEDFERVIKTPRNTFNFLQSAVRPRMQEGYTTKKKLKPGSGASS